MAQSCESVRSSTISPPSISRTSVAKLSSISVVVSLGSVANTWLECSSISVISAAVLGTGSSTRFPENLGASSPGLGLWNVTSEIAR